MSDGGARTCLRCGYVSTTTGAFCRRCGLPYGAAPAVATEDAPAECPLCYARADRAGLYPAPGGGRTTYERHAYDHEVRPVGDDDWLETLRDGEEIVIGRWRAPFDLTRRYLVTGQWTGGKERTYAHNAVVIAMVGASRGVPAGDPGPAGDAADPWPRLRFLRRPARQPQRSAAGAGAEAEPPPTDETVAARQAVDAVRERYLAGSRR